MSLHICVLKSGSGGNCTAIWSEKGAILVDCGSIKLKDFKNQLSSIKLTPNKIRGILISHGHGDHIDSDTFRIAQEYKIPIYIHKRTFKAINGNDCFDGPKCLIRHHSNRMFSISNFKIKPFKTRHGRYHNEYVGLPLGFCISRKHKGKKLRIGYITDTQVVNDDMIEILRNCSCLIIESNHSRKKIERDGSRHHNWRDHLSNDSAANAIKKIIESSDKKRILSHVFLAHISQENNSRMYMKKELFKKLKKEKSMPKKLIFTHQYQKTRVYEIE